MEDLFTSESVTEGHPDKLADQISDHVLDACLKEDPESRTACETLLARGIVFVAGETAGAARPDIPALAKEVIEQAGYDSPEKGLDYRSCNVLPFLNKQSMDIQRAVGRGTNQGAGDQGLIFGYAVNETPEAMPLSIHLAHKLAENLAKLRKKLFAEEGHDVLWPDGKSQVTVRYKNGKVQDIATIVISSQHAPFVRRREVEEFLEEELVRASLSEKYLTEETDILINPGGRFVTGGPSGDCGLTGRKIVVDTYGGHGACGGGAFSGKDPSKVDRSAAYAARHIAKNIVAAGLAEKCLIQLSYAIGVFEPVSVRVDDFGTSPLSREKLQKMILKFWDLSPSGIIKELDLLKPRYRATSVYGHFGRKHPLFTWEKTNKAKKLREWAGTSLKRSG